ncbi:MAG: hypothetical protein R3D84_17885 [Paracoccaceae bacterium]
MEHLPTAGGWCSTTAGTTAPVSNGVMMGVLFAHRIPGIHAPGPEVERMLVRSGIRLYKYWFSVTRGEQETASSRGQTSPTKRWKLSPIDKASLDKWDDYAEAKEAMFFHRHRRRALDDHQVE